jgi:hypothetical protein
VFAVLAACPSKNAKNLRFDQVGRPFFVKTPSFTVFLAEIVLFCTCMVRGGVTQNASFYKAPDTVSRMRLSYEGG